MKKIFATVTAVIIIAGVFIPCVSAAKLPDGDLWCADVNGRMTVVLYVGKEKTVTIPSTYNGKKVTKIGNNAFGTSPGIEKVNIPSGVEIIGEMSFSGCKNLKEITLPNTVTSIGLGAFYGCASLKSVTIPSGVTSIGLGAFLGCDNLKSVTFKSKKPPEIDTTAFSYCPKLEKITVPKGAKSAYSKINALKNYKIIEK